MTLSEALEASATYDYLVNEVLVIDSVTREITVPDDEIILGVYHDRNVERKYFQCPRIVGDNIDLSAGYIFVNYESVGGVTGAYQCDDIEIDGDNITFSWLLSDNVFDSNKDGTVSFAVQAKNVDYETVFGTQIASGKAYKTIEGTEEILSEYADLITQFLARVEEVEATATAAAESAAASAESAEELAEAALAESEAVQSANAAAESATLAESWAVGGTDTRDGEDTDNSKYYAEAAAASAAEAAASAESLTSAVEYINSLLSAEDVEF